MTNEIETRHALERIQSRLSWLQTQVNLATGIRDGLLRELLDNEGVDDRRPVAVR
jgi:hypothetical protein